MGIGVDKGSSLAIHVLIDDEGDMNFRFDNFKSFKNNLINLKHKLNISAQTKRRSCSWSKDHVVQFMKNIKMVDCVKGSAWEFPAGISPFGNCQHFLYKNQITPTKVQGKLSQHNYHAIVSEYSTCSDTRVNFVMNPIKSYPDPFAEIFDESQVERNLEKMFDVDSLGISSEERTVCGYDKRKLNVKTPSNSKIAPIPLSSLGMRTK